MKIVTLFAGAALCIAAPALADTVHLKNGTMIHGNIIEQDGGKIVVEVGSRRIPYRAEEVLSTEENDLTGRVNLAEVRQRVEAQTEALRQATGMSPEQYQELRSILKDLPSSDETVAKGAFERLITLGKKVDLITYFEDQLPRYSPRYVPRLLEAVYALDAVRGGEIASRHVFDTADDCRVKALEILARVKDPKSVEIFARGLMDRNAAARIVSADGIGVLEEKRATLLLIANLGNGDRRVQNASRDALMHFWGETLGSAKPQTLAEWQQVWDQKLKSQVGDAYDPATTEPLVAPDQHWQNE